MTGQVESEPTKKLDASNVTALGYQAAGRGVNDLKGRPGILVSGQGHALKQVQDPPQGPREVQFYQKISSSDDPECLKWRELAPTFYGIESMEGADGKSSQYLVLENLTSGLAKPCVMDIKPGVRTWPPEATLDKIARASAKCPGTKIPFGFGIQGMALHTDKGLKRIDKTFGHALDATTVHTILENYLGIRSEENLNLAKSFLEKMKDLEKFFESQTVFHNFGCSMLFLYDHGNASSAQVRLIDFVHAFPGNGEIDEGFLFGLKNVRSLFEEFIDGNEKSKN